MIESRGIPELVFARLPVFSRTWRLYDASGPMARLHPVPLMMALGIYASRLASNRDEASLDHVFRFVEEVHQQGSNGAVGVVVHHFLEVFAAGLNEMCLEWAQFEALAGPRTRESVDMFRGLGLWDNFELPRGLAELLR